MTTKNNQEKWIKEHTFYCRPLSAWITPRQCFTNKNLSKNPDAPERLRWNCPNCESCSKIEQPNEIKFTNAKLGTCKVCKTDFIVWKMGNCTMKNLCPTCWKNQRKDAAAKACTKARAKRVSQRDKIVIDLKKFPKLRRLIEEIVCGSNKPYDDVIVDLLNEVVEMHKKIH